MNVTLAADGAGVPEPVGHRFDRLHDVAISGRMRINRLECAQRRGGQHGAGPCPEILCGKVLSADVPKIRVHVARADALPMALDIEILEQRLSRQVLTPFDAASQRRIFEVDRLEDAALRPEPEVHESTAHRHVPILQRRQAKGTIGLRVLLVPDTNQRRLEQPDDRRQHALAGQRRLFEIGAHAPADRGQRAGKRDHAPVLHAVAHFGPARMIAILLAPRASRPVTCRWPCGSGEIQTSRQAGGITSDRMRASVAASRRRRPFASR